MVLQNTILLRPNEPARMHFADHWIESVTVNDPLAGRPLPKNRLRFAVDELNGKEVSAYFSTLSQKLAAEFSPYLPEKTYRQYDFIVQVKGSGFTTEYQVQVMPRPGR